MNNETVYYTISDVSKKLNIPTHVLRFWEKKFSIINPSKSSKGRRYYSNLDLSNIKIIKNLLYEKGFTINGALKHMKNGGDIEKDAKKYNFEIKEKINDCYSLILNAKSILNKY